MAKGVGDDVKHASRTPIDPETKAREKMYEKMETPLAERVGLSPP